MDPADFANACPSKIAAATASIIRAGRYQITSEREEASVEVALEPRARVRQAGKATKTLCTPHLSLAMPCHAVASTQPRETQVKLTLFDGYSYEAAAWLVETSCSIEPCVLDFASDSEPGGGWKGKQRGTQEEALCRASNLGFCLEEHYENVGVASYMPHLSVVYCPDIIVFRDSSSNRLLEQPYWVGVIAAALRCTGSDAEIRTKIDGVLRAAAAYGYKQLVLGAWGCGAFGNDPGQIAMHMLEAIREYEAWFDHIVFAVPHGENFEAFHDKLQGRCDVTVGGGRSAERNSLSSSKLTEQHKWELLTTIPECIEEAIKQAGVSPENCQSTEGARRSAAVLLEAIRAACIAELAKSTSQDIVARYEQVLPPSSTRGGGDARSVKLSEIERDICSAFEEATQSSVREFIKKQRRDCRGH